MKYGLIAGNGRFPFLVLEGARQQGVEMVVAAIAEETDPAISDHVRSVEWMSVGQLGKLIGYFKREGVTHAIMAGQVKHVQIFKLTALPDLRMAKLLARLSFRNTDSLIGAVADELAGEGITLVDSTAFLAPYLPAPGVLTSRKPSEAETADIAYGLEVAREIARLDLGQTIVIKDRAVVAVEAMEGTDATIRRAGELARKPPITVVKVAKPNQDMRFDVPVIGPATIRAMVEARASALSITAHKTLLLDRDELLELANREKIAIVANE
ncbi:MAG TPA: UDP-2,3-diacylglucosamine diphosphatase LpxI [Blastocatellia bacterium]|nr:UDP-2,3-diacylglucosamine diphosphatase LpxI [Blastocatellia bacterium]